MSKKPTREKQREYNARWRANHRDRVIAYTSRPDVKARLASLKKKKYEEFKSLVNSIKIARGCETCGYKAHPVALHFDHIDVLQKKQNIGSMLDHFPKMEDLLSEIKKCRVLCANCHSIKTYENNDYRRGALRKTNAVSADVDFQPLLF